MKLRSLGYRSDLIFTQFDGLTEDRGSYLIVRTPSSPNYFLGNLLIFEHPPRAGDFQKWTTLFKREFDDPRIYHQTFAWNSSDGATGDVSEFLKNGFSLDNGVVLTATMVHPPQKFHPTVVVKPLVTDQDWEDSVQVQAAWRFCGWPTGREFRGFYRRRPRAFPTCCRTSGLSKTRRLWHNGF